MSVTVVVGNPKPNSRTRAAAVQVARELTGAEPDLVLEVADLGPGLLGWGDPRVAEAVAAVQASSLVIVASPTYKASFTGLLKLFLDQFAAGSLAGVVTVPLMLGAGPAHALAAELHLKPVLAELGGISATPALFLLDQDWADSPALATWLERARPVVARLTAVATGS